MLEMELAIGDTVISRSSNREREQKLEMELAIRDTVISRSSNREREQKLERC